jgi:hypothetical protein
MAWKTAREMRRLVDALCVPLEDNAHDEVMDLLSARVAR